VRRRVSDKLSDRTAKMLVDNMGVEANPDDAFRKPKGRVGDREIEDGQCGRDSAITMVAASRRQYGPARLSKPYDINGHGRV